MNYVNTNSNENKDENNLNETVKEKKWSSLSEEEKTFYVQDFLDSYKLYNKTKIIEGVKDSVKSSVYDFFKYMAFLFVCLILLTIVAKIFGGIVALFVFIIGLVSLRAAEGLNSIKSLLVKREPRKNKGNMFLDYLNTNGIILDTDISPSMILELYRE